MAEPVAKRTRGALTPLTDKANQQLQRGKATKLLVMSNELLLTNIFKRLSACHLLSLRKTDTKWNHSVIPHLICKHRPIELDFDLDENEERSVDKFIELMESSTKIPFSNYRLGNCRRNVLDFASVVGHTVKKVSIHWIWDEYWMSSKVRQFILEQLPQLTDLEFSFSEPAVWKPSPKELEELAHFSATLRKRKVEGGGLQLPNLKRFKFKFINDLGKRTWACQIVYEVLGCAIELEELLLPCPRYNERGYNAYEKFLDPILGHMRNTKKNMHKLKHLEIGNVNLSILETLLGMACEKENALGLETFSMSVTGDGWMPDDDNLDAEEYDRYRREMREKLKSFLGKQAPTVRELSLWLPHEDREIEVIPITLPQMERLHTLTITDPDVPIHFDEHRTPELQFDGQTFESTFPGLKKLKYDTHEDHDPEEELRKTAHAGLTEIILQIDINQLRELPTLFPSLTRLELFLRSDYGDNDNVEECASIWTMWPLLTHLNLTCGLIDKVKPDKHLTGVPGGQLAALKVELDTLIAAKRPTFEELSGLVRKYKTRPGISALTRLEEFELDWFYYGDEEQKWVRQLSDTAVYCGLALVGPQLRKITFVGEVGDLLSEDCLGFMRTQGEIGGHIYPNTVVEFK